MSEYQFNPNQEQWKEIPGFPGYDVSDHGKVRSYWKAAGKGGGQILTKIPQRIMKTRIATGGYLYIQIQKFPRLVHRLVLVAFVGPCPPGMECCHKDGNPSNPVLDNLRWDTPKNNAADKHRHGTFPIGEQNGCSKVTNKDVENIRKLYSQGTYSQQKLGNLFGITKTAIRYIIKRRTWKHI